MMLQSRIYSSKNNTITHSAHKDVPDFLWYSRCQGIHEFRVFGWKLEGRINTYLHQLDDRTESGYFFGTTATNQLLDIGNMRTQRQLIIAPQQDFMSTLPNSLLVNFLLYVN